MDQYIVQKALNGRGTFYYFKNGLLHREAGPAIVDDDNKAEFTDLGDEGLYKEEIIQSALPKNYEKSIINYKKDPLFDLLFTYYYLEGKSYSKEEFDKLISIKRLNENLTNELPTSDKKNKINTIKVKV